MGLISRWRAKFGAATEASIDYPYRPFLKASNPYDDTPCANGRLIGENVYEWWVNTNVKILVRRPCYASVCLYSCVLLRACLRVHARLSFVFPLRYKRILASHRSSRSSDSLFSFIWTTDWAHANINLQKRADRPTHDLIAEMRRKGDLNDSVLVFLSDHGLRHSGFVETEIGKYEGELWRCLTRKYCRDRFFFPMAHSFYFPNFTKI